MGFLINFIATFKLRSRVFKELHSQSAMRHSGFP